MPAPASPAKATTAVAEPQVKMLRCVILTKKATRRNSKGEDVTYEVPAAPFHFKSFGGKAFAVETYTKRTNAEGEVENIPTRGIIEEFLVGGPNCELERVKSAIKRKVVRWRNEANGRGDILSKRNVIRKQDARGNFLEEWEELPNPQFIGRPGDVPLSEFVAIEEVVEGSDRGPRIPLE